MVKKWFLKFNSQESHPRRKPSKSSGGQQQRLQGRLDQDQLKSFLCNLVKVAWILTHCQIFYYSQNIVFIIIHRVFLFIYVHINNISNSVPPCWQYVVLIFVKSDILNYYFWSKIFLWTTQILKNCMWWKLIYFFTEV